jgi:hypothetical protein
LAARCYTYQPKENIKQSFYDNPVNSDKRGFFLAVPLQASTPNNISPKIIEACSTSNKDNGARDFCIVYTKCVIDGAKRIDDVFVTNIINERKMRSEFLDRVYLTHACEIPAKYGVTEETPFCLIGSKNLIQIAVSIINQELEDKSLGAIKRSFYNYMTKNFACRDL